jgi:hypothetical protein
MWRTKALELFPDMRSEIQAVESISTLWIKLHVRFQQYYESVEQDDSTALIRNICMYAIWCDKSDAPDVQNPAWIEFYETLPIWALQSESPSTDESFGIS